MFWRRRKPTRKCNQRAAEIRTARQELRWIERDLKSFDHRSDINRLRWLTAKHAAWRESLAQHGVNHPAPLIHW